MDNALNLVIFVAPSENLATRSLTFPAEISSVIERVDGVDQVQVLRDARVTYHEVPVMVIAIETEKVASTVHRRTVAGSLEEMNCCTTEGKGMIGSESFATHVKTK